MSGTRRSALLTLAVWLTACGPAEPTSVASTPASAPPSVAATAAVSAPGAATPSAPPAPSVLRPSEGFAVGEITLSDGQRHVDVPVFIADTAQLRQRGLMERNALPRDAGMLFVFEEPTVSGFWMKDTLIPLSIAFIGNGRRILEVAEMAPCDADPCPVHRPGGEYRYALEVNRGFFERHDIGPGWALQKG